ncbi:hypothetical protein EPO04_04090 [Patescibacteria group bacterium]|nr:MAG: hypothetical protein EPO04_04090 [Patescibacteria group bacterium]
MKVDFKKSLDSYKAKHGEFRVLEVPSMQYLMVDGHGAPEAPDFAHAIEAVYPVAYTLKFMSKQQLDKDYVVPPMEGLWWADDMSVYASGDKSQWDWTVLLMVPDWITDEMFEAAKQKVASKKEVPVHLDKIRLETLAEGTCVQTLHIGSFDNEGPVLSEMHNTYIPEHGYKMTGRHHEIYMSDMRRVPEDKLKTILRQPVEKI